MIMQCLFEKVCHFFFPMKLQKYQNTMAFKYCIIEFVYVYISGHENLAYLKNILVGNSNAAK